MSPATAIAFGELGGLGVLNLEGLWTRYANPQPLLDEMGELGEACTTRRLQEIYSEPIKAELITERLRQIVEAGVPVAGALSPQNAQQFADVVERAGLDFFVIRGTAVSAQHVSNAAAPLDLAKFIYELEVPVIVGGCATYQTALHLMRTGAAGELVGFGGAATSTNAQVIGIEVPMATAISDAAGPPRLPGRDRWPLRPRHRRRLDGALRRRRQGVGLRRGRRDARGAAGQGHRGSRSGLALGPGGLAREPAARPPGAGGAGRHA